MTESTPTFKQAMNATLLWCQSWEQQEISDEVFAERIGELLNTIEGARGFFVITLSSDCPIMDRIPDSLIYKLREAGEVVVDLTVKNLAMSSAMAVHHSEKNNLESKAQSTRIKYRCIELLKLLEANSVKERIENLSKGIAGQGADFNFLKKWDYNQKQKDAISQSILELTN